MTFTMDVPAQFQRREWRSPPRYDSSLPRNAGHLLEQWEWLPAGRICTTTKPTMMAGDGLTASGWDDCISKTSMLGLPGGLASSSSPEGSALAGKPGKLWCGNSRQRFFPDPGPFHTDKKTSRRIASVSAVSIQWPGPAQVDTRISTCPSA